MFFLIHFEHDDLDDIAYGDGLARVADKPVADLGDMYEAILMHADIDERAEVNHVSDGSGQLHPGLQILYLEHVPAQQDRRELVARVAPRLHKFGGNIAQGRLADAALSGGLRDPVGLESLCEPGKLSGSDIVHGVCAEREQL